MGHGPRDERRLAAAHARGGAVRDEADALHPKRQLHRRARLHRRLRRHRLQAASQGEGGPQGGHARQEGGGAWADGGTRLPEPLVCARRRHRRGPGGGDGRAHSDADVLPLAGGGRQGQEARDADPAVGDHLGTWRAEQVQGVRAPRDCQDGQARVGAGDGRRPHGKRVDRAPLPLDWPAQGRAHLRRGRRGRRRRRDQGAVDGGEAAAAPCRRHHRRRSRAGDAALDDQLRAVDDFFPAWRQGRAAQAAAAARAARRSLCGRRRGGGGRR
mmetsp:Transcript_54074/g.160365  ORF Transcript_54074/g.160365 Transcript_54074/m.160365 type:complete len:271 (+) Transcript_54074:723-1535(+)